MNYEITIQTPEASVSHLFTKSNCVEHYLIGHLFPHNPIIFFTSCQAGPTDKGKNAKALYSTSVVPSVTTLVSMERGHLSTNQCVEFHRV